jgi:hypothetical protein
LFKGSLPWQGIRAPEPTQKTQRIGERKIATTLEYLCREDPPQFLKYMKYCRNLKFEETPDYEMCRMLFRELAKEEGIQWDWIFDWVTRRNKELADGPPTEPTPSSNPVHAPQSET